MSMLTKAQKKDLDYTIYLATCQGECSQNVATVLNHLLECQPTRNEDIIDMELNAEGIYDVA